MEERTRGVARGLWSYLGESKKSGKLDFSCRPNRLLSSLSMDFCVCVLSWLFHLRAMLLSDE